MHDFEQNFHADLVGASHESHDVRFQVSCRQLKYWGSSKKSMFLAPIDFGLGKYFRNGTSFENLK
jgi:hypothetical protein